MPDASQAPGQGGWPPTGVNQPAACDLVVLAVADEMSPAVVRKTFMRVVHGESPGNVNLGASVGCRRSQQRIELAPVELVAVSPLVVDEVCGVSATV